MAVAPNLVSAITAIPSVTLAVVPALVASVEALPFSALLASSNPQLVNTRVTQLQLGLTIKRQPIAITFEVLDFSVVIFTKVRDPTQSQKKSVDL